MGKRLFFYNGKELREESTEWVKDVRGAIGIGSSVVEAGRNDPFFCGEDGTFEKQAGGV